MQFELSQNVGPVLARLIEDSEAAYGLSRSTFARGVEGKVYVRVAKRVLPSAPGELTDVLDLSTIVVEPQMRGKGVFTEVLVEMEKAAAISGRALFIESVLDPYLLMTLPSKGYRPTQGNEGETGSCFYRSHADLAAQWAPAAAPKKTRGFGPR